ncbi:MAG: radical SAM protein [Methanomassiliicoccales archaeon]|nr:MAG: radical SAM protein [Methanomassiliicoccales archaeon]
MIRVAIGTASVLGLTNIKMSAYPTTAHLMTPGKCKFSCKFCTQSNSSTADDKLLSRISWPEHESEKVLTALQNKQDRFQRVCLQVVHSNGPEDFLRYVKEIRKRCDIPLSVDLKADDMATIRRTFEAGADVVGLPIDAANKEVFAEVKEGSFLEQLDLIKKAASEFEGKISTHLIIGLGETEKDAVELMNKMHEDGVVLALFAFTPIKGTALENKKRPSIEHYRRIQAARFLIYNDFAPNFKFDEKERIAGFGISSDELSNRLKPSAFQTTGCLGCNRPFYNESPGKVLYNYPYVPSQEEFNTAFSASVIGLVEDDG